jgi:ABC-type multidrug transport system ATPase subunit/ABC-type multidrug transport system permease subunit
MFGFVHAHEALFPTDTPQEAFKFAATLELSHKSIHDQEEVSERTLRSLRLLECKDTYIGSISLKGISSGEKKRTAVGIELIGGREVVFLDEPTTGLDSETAYELISLLRKLVLEQGVCVVAVIHQPSSKIFELFDNVMFMARGGQIVYHGPVADQTDYFSSQGYIRPRDHNPSDYIMFLLQTLGEGAIGDLANRHRRTMDEVKDEIVIARGHPVGRPHYESIPKLAPWRVQFRALLAREYKSTVRDRSVVFLRLLISLFFALLISFLFFQVGSAPGGAANPSHVGLLFSLGTFALVTAGQSLLIAYASERPIMLREVASGMYHPVVYSISKDLLELPLVFVNVMLYATLGYLIGGLVGPFLLITLGMLLIGISGAAISFFFASVITTVEVAAIFASYLLIVQILFSGFFVAANQIPAVLGWIQYANPLKYGLDIMTIAEFQGLPGAETLFATGNIVPSMLLAYIFILLGIIIAFRIAATLALWLKSRKSVE